MTISQIRRRIDALKRRFAAELAIIKARRIAEAVADDWKPSQPPDPSHVVKRFADAGFRLPTFARLHSYLEDNRRKGDIPGYDVMVCKLLPWAWDHRYDRLLDFDLPAPAR